MESTRAIVLNLIHFSDSQNIAQVYTDKFGRISVIYSTKKKKDGVKLILQPLYQVELTLNTKTKSEIKRASAISLWMPYSDIPYNHQKIFVNLFLSEFLSRTLIEQEPNPNLFEFLSNALMLFDKTSSNWTNFHLYFLVHFMKYVGITPSSEMANKNNDSVSFYRIVNSQSITEFTQSNLTRSERNLLLSKILDYYKDHLPIGDMISYRVFSQM